MKEDLSSTYCNITAIFGGNKQKEMDGRGKREREREREGGREREELLRFAKEGRRKDLDGRRREQIRPPTSKRKHPLFGGKKKGGLFGGEFGQGFVFFVSILQNSAPPPRPNKNTFFSVFSFWQFYIIVKMAIIHRKI